MKMMWHFIFLAILASLGCRSAHAQDFPFARPYFENVGDRDSIPGGVVTAMVRAPNGLLWLGTQSGLLRYDGYRFKQYEFDPLDSNSISGNFINALAATPDGRIWIGTANDGLSIFDPSTEQFRNFRNSASDRTSISAGAVTAFAHSDEGMWIGTQTGLTRFDLQQSIFTHFPAQLHGANRPNLDRIRSLHLDRHGDLWIGTWDGVRFKAKTSSAAVLFKSEPNELGFAGQVINTILHMQDDSIWIGTRQHGLASVQHDGIKLMRLNIDAVPKGLASNRIQAILQASRTEVWVATTSGINILDADKFSVSQHFSSDKTQIGALALDAIGALTMDSSGMIWVGTWGGGLQKIQPSNLSFRSLRMDAKGAAGLSFADVHAALELTNGKIWIGTGGTGIDIFDRQLGRIGNHPASGPAGNGLSDGIVVAMVQASESEVFVGTQTGGLFQANLNTGKFKQIGQAGSVSDLLIASDGALWLGGSQGVAKLDRSKSDAVPEVVVDTEGKPVLGQVNPLVQDQVGRIWAGSADGLRVLLPGETRFQIIRKDPSRADSLVHNSVFGLLVDRAGNLWVATEQGIDRMLSLDPRTFDPARAQFSHISAEFGRPGRDMGANLLEDEQGRIWTYNAVIDLAEKRIFDLTPADGVDIGTAWTGAYTKLRNGLFLHGGTEGLLIVDPQRFNPWDFAPEVVATELRINGLNQPVAQLGRSGAASGMTLSPKQRSFSVEFAALDFSSPQDNRYRYRLEVGLKLALASA